MAHTPPLTRLRHWLRAEKRDLVVAVIYSAAIGLMSLVVPVAVQSLVNTVAFGTLFQPLVILTLIVLTGLGFSAILQGMRTFVIEIIQRRIFVRVASESASRLLKARVEAFDHHHGPELVNRFLEVVTVQKSAAMLLIDGLSIAMQTIIGMALLAVYHPWLLAFDAFLLAIMVVVLFPMGRGAIITSVEESKAKYSLVAWLEEIARWPITFKSAPGATLALHRTDALVRTYLTDRSRHFRILLRQILGFLTLQAIASSVLLGVGGWLVINRQLTLGQLIAAELIVTLLVNGFSKFGKQLETFYDLAAAVDKLGYISDLPAERSGRALLSNHFAGLSLTLRGVGFGYPANPSVLTDVTLEVPPGSCIGFAGTGKSTLMDILYGLRPPSTGIVEIGNNDLRELSLDSLRHHVALVRQPEIFHGTIVENLQLGNPDATLGELRNALHQVGLLEEVQTLPNGMDTELATGGQPLSPSQAMRLMLARALLQGPPLLLLDECLDAIESREQRRVLLSRLRAGGSTVLLASRDADSFGLCDQVYEIRSGSLTRWQPATKEVTK